MLRVRILIVIGAFICALGALYATAAAPRAQPASPCQTFPETGQTVCEPFLSYWRNHGGLAQQGYPISAEFTEVSQLNGKPYTVQYFERAVFEKHPENQPPYDVLLSQLGTYMGRQKYPAGFPTPGASGPGKIAYSTAGEQPQVYIVNPDGSGRTLVAPGRSPLFAPDGARLAFLSVVHPSTPAEPFGLVAIRVTSLDGSGAQDLCTSPGNAQIDLARWSPHGATIAWNAGQNPPGAIYLCNVGSKQLSAPVQSPQGTVARIFEWSADEAHALWQAGATPADMDLYFGDSAHLAGAVKITSGQLRATAFGFAGYMDARTSPDGATIAIAGARIFFISAPGHTSPLAGKTLDAPAQPVRLAWSPDGHALAVEDNATHTVSVVDIASGQVTKLADNAALGDWSSR
jgi:hypothetical protein